MSIEQNVGTIMAEIGPLAGLLAVRQYSKKRMWQLAVDESTIVFADLGHSDQMLVLSAEIGPPPETAGEDFYELLLRYANAWRETGGLRISMGEGDHSLWLLRDCCAIDLGLQQFAENLADFVAKTHAWRQGLGAYESGEVQMPPPPDEVQSGFLRA